MVVLMAVLKVFLMVALRAELKGRKLAVTKAFWRAVKMDASTEINLVDG
jgi:Arc/MetJ family transcription regulator